MIGPYRYATSSAEDIKKLLIEKDSKNSVSMNVFRDYLRQKKIIIDEHTINKETVNEVVKNLTLRFAKKIEIIIAKPP